MKAEKLMKEIEKLDLSEKLLLIEDVWDDIARTNENLPLSDWQAKELEIRLKSYDKGEMETKNCDEVHEELRNKYK